MTAGAAAAPLIRGDGLRVLVCGGRRYSDAETLGSWLGGIHRDSGIGLIIHGGARGADRLAGLFAEFARIPCEAYSISSAEWRRYGLAAGPLRNQRMLDDGKPDLVVAFPGGAGTADMVRRARQARIRVCQVAESVRGIQSSTATVQP